MIRLLASGLCGQVAGCPGIASSLLPVTPPLPRLPPGPIHRVLSSEFRISESEPSIKLSAVEGRRDKWISPYDIRLEADAGPEVTPFTTRK
jgi:hypothetical protein